MRADIMKELHAIIVATDFSEDASRAARRGALLADELGLPAELLHVVNAPGLESVRAWFRDRSDIAERLTADARRSLDAAAAAIATPGRPVSTRLVVGDVHDELIAESDPGVLLVLGARGESTVGELLFGSTAERVVRDSAGPVLVVRSEARAPYRDIVVGVDLAQGCASMLDDVVAFAPAARLTALNAYRVLFEGALQRAGVPLEEIGRQRAGALQAALDAIDAMDRRRTVAGQRVIPAAERGDPARVLVDHARRTGADLLAVARRSRSTLASLLIGSVARRVVAEADRDVLVLRGPALA
jgi:nucleotide-binding universal stress UspA family protein